jgi:hypothetical protein
LEAEIQQKPIDALLAENGQFEQAFAAALKSKHNQGSEVGTEHQRRAIAHLLFNISADDAERQRIAPVIGLKAYVDEANQQAFNLRQMSDRLVVGLTEGQGDFESEYKRVVGELQILDRALEQRKAELQSEKAHVEQHQTLLAARVADVQRTKAELEQARQQTQAALGELTKEQQLLFAAQERVGRSVEANQRLEHEIATLEKNKR